MPVSEPARPPDTVVRVANQRFMLEMPRDWWQLRDDGDAEMTTLVRERRHVTVTIRSRVLDDGGFVATADAVRREALDAGAEVRRGSHATHVTDRFGRRVTSSLRRLSGAGEIEDGELAVVELDGRQGVLVVFAWWPESPSSWMVDEVHHIVDSIRAIP